MEDVRADSGFMRQLRVLDRRLGVMFNGTHFVITFTTQRYGAVNIWKVVDERGGFRQPDQRELDMLQQADIEKVGPEERFNLVKAYMQRYQEKKRTDARDTIRDITKEDRRQLMQAFGKAYGSGKGNATFRRIIPVRRGVVVP